MRPILAVTIGDAAGIGPEVVLKALSHKDVYDMCRPIVVGDPRALERELRLVDGIREVRVVGSVGEAEFVRGRVDVLVPYRFRRWPVPRGVVDPEAGRATYEFVREAVRLALSGEVDGMVTAPLNKEALNRAGLRYPGHTELLAELTGTEVYRMMLVGGGLKVAHVTTHLPVREACDLITRDRVLETVRLAGEWAEGVGVRGPVIGVLGLNPHAGEGGLFGREDAEEIAPAVESAREEGWDARGPLPPDTAFWRAREGEFDVLVAMLHDQGHIPLKLMAFHDCVNITLGLPIVRTSVGHGTAFDISGSGRADPRSLVEAIRWASLMAKGGKDGPLDQEIFRLGSGGGTQKAGHKDKGPKEDRGRGKGSVRQDREGSDRLQVRLKGPPHKDYPSPCPQASGDTGGH